MEKAEGRSRSHLHRLAFVNQSLLLQRGAAEELLLLLLLMELSRPGTEGKNIPRTGSTSSRRTLWDVLTSTEQLLRVLVDAAQKAGRPVSIL